MRLIRRIMIMSIFTYQVNHCCADHVPIEVVRRIEQVLATDKIYTNLFIADLTIEETVSITTKSEHEIIEELREEYTDSDEWRQQFKTADDFIKSALSFVLETAQEDANINKTVKVRVAQSGSYANYTVMNDGGHGNPTYEEVQYRDNMDVWQTVRIDHSKKSIDTFIRKTPLYYEYIFPDKFETLDRIAWQMAVRRSQPEHDGASLIEAMLVKTNQYIDVGSFRWKLSFNAGKTIATLTVGPINNPHVVRKYDIDISVSPARIIGKQFDNSEETVMWRFDYSVLPETSSVYPHKLSYVLSKRNRPGDKLMRIVTFNRMVLGQEWPAKDAYEKLLNKYIDYEKRKN